MNPLQISNKSIQATPLACKYSHQQLGINVCMMSQANALVIMNMNEADISQILPSIEQQSTRFVEISRNKPKQIVQSTAFQKIFYKKRSMKELLEERTTLCMDLSLTSSRKQNSNIDRVLIANNFCLLFRDGPSWTILEDRGTIYGFLASEQKFVPHCKACNFSVYVSLRGTNGRITCSNCKCRIKLLSEFELAAAKSEKGEKKEVRQREQRAVSQVGTLKTEEKAQTNLQQMELIKRAAKRIAL